MKLYRLSKSRFASDLTGEGARLHGGRWNRISVPCLYTSENRALAVLEYSANTSLENIPRGLSMVTLEVPEGGMLELNIADLPGDWKTSPATASTKDFGSKLLSEANNLIIRLPSIIIPDEYNCIVNPLHKDIGLVTILDVCDFVYDVRIKSEG